MSVRRDGSFIRSQRLIQIGKRIAVGLSEFKTVDVEQLILWIQMNLGLTEKRASEYVAVVVKAKGWVLKDGEITAEI